MNYYRQLLRTNQYKPVQDAVAMVRSQENKELGNAFLGMMVHEHASITLLFSCLIKVSCFFIGRQGVDYGCI